MARKKRGKNKLAKLSLGDLQRMVVAKQAEIEKLRARRVAVAAELADLDSKISAAGGSAGGESNDNGAVAGRSSTGLPTKRRGRPKGSGKGKRRGRKPAEKGQSDLHNAIRDALRGSKEPMKIADIATAVKKSGYVTKSASFNVILGLRLPEMADVRRVRRGEYELR